MPLPRTSRERLAGTLSSAFADGLLSELTLSHRLGALFGQPLVNPQQLVGDLSVRAERRSLRRALHTSVDAIRQRLGRPCSADAAPLLLGLDWSTSSPDDLLIGRDGRCRLRPGDQLRLGAQALEVD